ncbi:hypothetical protein AJ79_01244 [Helicocarpus griseus UAMH5409]|uniref:Zn(2)-C6 fungal-type domain-containing protein n=1 Tax=Helicocarpus griseus UAMH5409 TaxID=1447875 RepID=A0A2B7Y833_9EURO|nr:hypothetical protein AJ79_01244 [Helicocarpus griseus UAMH5409]
MIPLPRSRSHSSTLPYSAYTPSATLSALDSVSPFSSDYDFTFSNSPCDQLHSFPSFNAPPFESASDLSNVAPSGYLAQQSLSDVSGSAENDMSLPVSATQHSLNDLDTGMKEEMGSMSPGSSKDQGVRLQEDAAGQNQTPTNDGGNDARGESTPSAQEPTDKENPRPWSELKTKAGKERKRLPLACIACRRKKIRCSGEKPACKHCYRSRVPCVYKVTTRKAAPRTDYMAMLDKRLKRMEERVIKIIPKDDPRDMAAIGRAVVKPPVPGQAPRGSRPIHRKRSADEAFNAELNEWAQQNKTSAEGFPLLLQSRITDEHKLFHEGAEYLPSLELQEHLAEVFFDCVYGQSYLLLHKPSFMRKLKAGTVPPVLMLAICAVSARFSTHPHVNSEPPFLRGENWANPAAAIALTKHEEPNITILTVFLILGLHEFGTCHGGRSWSFGGQAFRMAYALQLHCELDHDPLGTRSELSFTDREIRRRTMWACVLMDRYNSSGSQRPPIGNEKFLHIQLPIKESHFQMEIPGPTEDLDGNVPNPVPEGVGQLSNPKDNMGVSAYTIRALMLWGRIVDYLNLGGKAKDPHPVWSPNSGYTQLKKQLEDFSASLPNSLAFTLENLRNHAAEKIANQFLFLHIVTHQNILFLNRFAIPLSPGGRPPKDIPRPFLSDAGRAAVEAASHISMLINQASGYNLTVPFAGYCAYAASTVHIWGIFSKNARLEATSKENLRHTYRYLNKMKRYWGMFHYLVESAKDRYRQFADAAIKGVHFNTAEQDTPLFQYGDWFDKYPHGVAREHYEDPPSQPQREPGGDAVMAQQSDLQSVEDFFASLATSSHSEVSRKEPKRRAGSSTEPRQPRLSMSNSNNRYIPPQQAQPQPQPQAHPPLQPQIPKQPLIDVPINPTQPSDFNFSPQAVFPQAQAPPFDPNPYNFFNPDQLPQLDRQLVYGAYAGLDLPTSTPTSVPLPPQPSNLNPNPSIPTQQDSSNNPSNAAMWNSQFDMPGPGPGTWPNDLVQPSAWFLPFNLDPMGQGGPADLGTNTTTQQGSEAGANNAGAYSTQSNAMMGSYDMGV